MTLTIVEDLPSRLAEYAQVPMTFTVAARFDDQALAALRYDAPSRPSRSHHPTGKTTIPLPAAIPPPGQVSSNSRAGLFSRPMIARAGLEARWSLSMIPKSTCFAIVRRVRFSGIFAWRRMHAARALAPRSSKLPNGAPAIAVLAAFVSKRRTSMCQHVDSTTPKGFAWSERHREPTRSCRTRFSCSRTSRCVERSTRHSLGTWRRTRVSRFRLMPPATTGQSCPPTKPSALSRGWAYPGFAEDQKKQERPVGPSCAHFPTAIVRRSSTARRSRMSRSSPSRSSPGEASCRPAGTSRSRTSALHPHCSRR
jgi:hypothetical protein